LALLSGRLGNFSKQKFTKTAPRLIIFTHNFLAELNCFEILTPTECMMYLWTSWSFFSFEKIKTEKTLKSQRKKASVSHCVEVGGQRPF